MPVSNWHLTRITFIMGNNHFSWCDIHFILVVILINLLDNISEYNLYIVGGKLMGGSLKEFQSYLFVHKNSFADFPVCIISHLL